MSLQRLAERLTFQAIMEGSSHCDGACNPYPGVNSEDHRKPGHVIKNLSEDDREKVKLLKDTHFYHEQMFDKNYYTYIPKGKKNKLFNR